MANPVTEDMIVRNLIRGFCKDFENDVLGLVDDFFKQYDCLKSVDKSQLTRLIKTVITGFDSILLELT